MESKISSIDKVDGRRVIVKFVVPPFSPFTLRSRKGKSRTWDFKRCSEDESRKTSFDPVYRLMDPRLDPFHQ